MVNDSKVIPARLYGHVEGREEAGIELLLLKQRELDTWETLVKPGKRAKIGSRLVFGGGILRGEIVDIVDEGNRIIKFEYDTENGENIYAILHKITYRITNEVEGINRVLYDLTPKPTGTIEWE